MNIVKELEFFQNSDSGSSKKILTKCYMYHTDLPSSEDVNYLRDEIYKEYKEYKVPEYYGIFIKDENGEIIGGASYVYIYDVIYTQFLWVKKEYRKQSISTKLLNMIHEEGKKKNCKIFTIRTMDFQNAYPIYQKLGYEIEHESKGYENNSICFFMRKIVE